MKKLATILISLFFISIAAKTYNDLVAETVAFVHKAAASLQVINYKIMPCDKSHKIYTIDETIYLPVSKKDLEELSIIDIYKAVAHLKEETSTLKSLYNIAIASLSGTGILYWLHREHTGDTKLLLGISSIAGLYTTKLIHLAMHNKRVNKIALDALAYDLSLNKQ